MAKNQVYFFIHKTVLLIFLECFETPVVECSEIPDAIHLESPSRSVCLPKAVGKTTKLLRKDVLSNIKKMLDKIMRRYTW